jgi:glycosyltransferase involved in cell wall biosynthesis
MNIGFDAKRIVRNNTGLGSYGRTLVNDLAEIVPPDTRLCLYAPDEGLEQLRRQVTPRPSIRFCYPQGNAPKWYWRSKQIVDDLKRDRIQLFHGLSGELPVGIGRSGIKSVVTIHDLIFLRHPEYYKWFDRKVYEWKFRKTIQEADRIVAISECTKRDIMLLGSVPAEKIDLIYQSCSTFFKLRESEDKLQDVNARYMLPARYIVSVGTIEERKNILLAVKALHRLPADLSLVIVGRPTPYTDYVKHYVEENRLGDRVLMLHNVPNADLPSIYQMAEACVYPSRYEGFGIPVIEAIQSGLPVVACKGSCLEEAGGNDSIYVDPDDVVGMAEAVASVLKGAEGRDLRVARAQKYIQRFEGNDVASQMLDVYRQLVPGL